MHAVEETLRSYIGDSGSRHFEDTNVFHDADRVKGRDVTLTKSVRRLRFGLAPLSYAFL
jgi:hypothetical protein